ncbi:MAG TPA: ABC transporter permease [Ensifer sp.]|nr:ABC transporter permease [Ensifer sp.]
MSRHVYARLIWAPILYLALSLGVAVFIFLRNSLYTSAGFGSIVATVSASNFQKLVSDSYYAEVLGETILVSFIVVVISACLSLPIALYLRHFSTARARIYLVIVVASSAMSLVVRALGWISIMNDNGPINGLLKALHLIETPIAMIGTNGAIITGLVHGFVPVFVLTLFPVTQAIDRSVEQAAEGLGASRWQTLFTVLIPLSMPGLVSASLITFAMCMGAYTTPALLAGGKAMLFPILIQQQAMVVLNYPMAATLAFVLTIIVLGITWSSLAAARYFEPKEAR